MSEQIQDNLGRVREEVARAAESAGRAADAVKLIAVSKTFSAEVVQEAVRAGALDLGENRVQEAAAKAGEVKADGLRWHLIGHLQSNKAKLAVATFDWIHTMDSRALVERVDRFAGEVGRRPIVLAQVDLGKEATKSGADEAELPDLVAALDEAANLDFRGLMTLPPFFDDAEAARPYFRRLRELLMDLNRKRTPQNQLTELSMGMSHDFAVAIEEGATLVRIGTAIFGRRQKG